jgi:hypothetical protein
LNYQSTIIQRWPAPDGSLLDGLPKNFKNHWNKNTFSWDLFQFSTSEIIRMYWTCNIHILRLKKQTTAFSLNKSFLYGVISRLLPKVLNARPDLRWSCGFIVAAGWKSRPRHLTYGNTPVPRCTKRRYIVMPCICHVSPAILSHVSCDIQPYIYIYLHDFVSLYVIMHIWDYQYIYMLYACKKNHYDTCYTLCKNIYIYMILNYIIYVCI